MNINWVSIADSANWLLSLGVITAIVSAVITSVREKRSHDKELRSHLAIRFMETSVNALHSRLNPLSSEDSSQDAQLVYCYQMLLTEMTKSNCRDLKKYIDATVYRIRFGQPAPTLEDVVENLAPIIAAWVKKPKKANALASPDRH